MSNPVGNVNPFICWHLWWMGISDKRKIFRAQETHWAATAQPLIKLNQFGQHCESALGRNLDPYWNRNQFWVFWIHCSISFVTSFRMKEKGGMAFFPLARTNFSKNCNWKNGRKARFFLQEFLTFLVVWHMIWKLIKPRFTCKRLQRIGQFQWNVWDAPNYRALIVFAGDRSHRLGTVLSGILF